MPEHKKLLGNLTEAVKWLPFGRTQLRRFAKASRRYADIRKLQPDESTLILMRKVGKQLFLDIRSDAAALLTMDRNANDADTTKIYGAAATNLPWQLLSDNAPTPRHTNTFSILLAATRGRAYMGSPDTDNDKLLIHETVRGRALTLHAEMDVEWTASRYFTLEYCGGGRVASAAYNSSGETVLAINGAAVALPALTGSDVRFPTAMSYAGNDTLYVFGYEYDGTSLGTDSPATAGFLFIVLEVDLSTSGVTRHEFSSESSTMGSGYADIGDLTANFPAEAVFSNDKIYFRVANELSAPDPTYDLWMFDPSDDSLTIKAAYADAGSWGIPMVSYGNDALLARRYDGADYEFIYTEDGGDTSWAIAGDVPIQTLSYTGWVSLIDTNTLALIGFTGTAAHLYTSVDDGVTWTQGKKIVDTGSWVLGEQFVNVVPATPVLFDRFGD